MVFYIDLSSIQIVILSAAKNLDHSTIKRIEILHFVQDDMAIF